MTHHHQGSHLEVSGACKCYSCPAPHAGPHVTDEAKDVASFAKRCSSWSRQCAGGWGSAAPERKAQALRRAEATRGEGGMSKRRRSHSLGACIGQARNFSEAACMTGCHPRAAFPTRSCWYLTQEGGKKSQALRKCKLTAAHNAHCEEVLPQLGSLLCAPGPRCVAARSQAGRGYPASYAGPAD